MRRLCSNVIFQGNICKIFIFQLPLDTKFEVFIADLNVDQHPNRNGLIKTDSLL